LDVKDTCRFSLMGGTVRADDFYHSHIFDQVYTVDDWGILLMQIVIIHEG